MTMVVISLTNSPAQLRGYLTRYLSEIQSGLFVGSCSRRVQDALWERVKDKLPAHGKAILVYTDGNEQGYRIEYWNFPNRTIACLDDLEIPAIIDDENSESNKNNSGGTHWSKAYWRHRRS